LLIYDISYKKYSGYLGMGQRHMSAIRRWLIMTCLCLSGGIIYLLPYLREVYYKPMQEALHLTNTQLGVLMSVFGAVAMISYFPGGWIADRFSPRKLITFSLFATGTAGFYFAFFPSYRICIVIHAFWGISITLTFWAALIKATRNWAPSTQQGRAFGILEGGRGVAEVVSSTVLLGVFASLGSGDFALARVIVLFSVINIFLGVMAWFTLEDSNRATSEQGKMKIGLGDIIKVLKMPVVWLISLIILSAYSAYWGSFYFTPYATDVFKMSVVFGGALGVGKMWLKPLSALGAGFLGDKIGPSRVISWSFVVLIVSFIIFIITPGSPGLVLFLVVNTAVASLAIFALRGIYFALLEEGGIPLVVTGTATGIVSVLGYTPDVFMPIVGGALLDAFPPETGYRFFFAFITGLCIIGLLAAVRFRRKYSIKKIR
jgi:nitrate/nitrite transporter NarK